MLVFYIPVAGCLYPDRWSRMQKMYGFDDAGWEIELANENLDQICKRLQIAFINPIKSYRDEAEKLRQSDESLYFPRDGHWNRQGHRLPGEILATHILTDND